MMRRAVTFALALCLAAPALADTPPKKVAPAAMKSAREHFKKGQAAHAAGKYEEATAEYEAAYKQAPLPDLLFNLAQVQRLKGDKRQALDNYLKYLEEAPNGRGADESRQWVASLSKEIREDEEARRKRQEEEDKLFRAQREAEDKRRAEEMAARPGFGQPFAPPPPAAPKGQGLRVAGLVTGGAGIVALGLGTYFGLHAKSLSDQQKSLTEWDPNLVSDGKAANRNAIISFTVGGAALATGGILYYQGARAGRSAEKASVTVAPTVSPDGPGLVVVGLF
jgi:serine/threonine-protein kinase